MSRKKNPICLCIFLLRAYGGERSKQTLLAGEELEKEAVKEKETKKKKLSTLTHTLLHPVAFLPGVFVNHPFRSVSLWVGPLPFNAATFVARDSAAIQILCRRLSLAVCLAQAPPY